MSLRPTALLSLGMAAFCWAGLGYLVVSYPPDATARALFLCLLFLAIAFSSAPLLSAVHRRASATAEDALSRQGAVWREAMLLGLFISVCVWLRFARMLHWVNALLLGVVLVLTEILLLARG